jgi:hypothetical protein
MQKSQINRDPDPKYPHLDLRCLHAYHTVRYMSLFCTGCPARLMCLVFNLQIKSLVPVLIYFHSIFYIYVVFTPRRSAEELSCLIFIVPDPEPYRIRRILTFLDLPDPAPDPSINKQRIKKNLYFNCSVTS